MKNQWVVFAPSGKWQMEGIFCAKKLGYKILSIDNDKEAQGFKISDLNLVFELNQYEEIFKEIESLNINLITAISFCSDVGIELCAVIRGKFNLGGYDIKTAISLTNKKYQRLAWKKNKVYPPIKWKSFKTSYHALNYLKKNNSKNIIKPVDSSGSRGISVFEKFDNNTPGLIDFAFSLSKSKEIIIEEYFHGDEFTVEVFVQNNVFTILCITKKNKLISSNYTVSSEIFTVRLNKKLTYKIEKLIEKASRALNYYNGIIHSEILINEKDEIFLIEMAARGGGFGLNHYFVSGVTGLNISELTIKNFLFQKFNKIKSKNLNAYMRFIPKTNGTLKKIEIDKKIQELEEIKIELFNKEGDFLQTNNSDGDRIGLIIGFAINIESAKKKVDEAYRSIKIIME